MSKIDMGGPSKYKTLLDYFAGQALAGHFASGLAAERGQQSKEVAKVAYHMAAAMIAEKRRLEAGE